MPPRDFLERRVDLQVERLLTEDDRGKRVNVGHRVARTGDELAALQLPVEPFELVVRRLELRRAVVFELLDPVGEHRARVLERAPDGSEQVQFRSAAPSLDLGNLARVAAEQVRIGMERLEIAAPQLARAPREQRLRLLIHPQQPT